MNRCQAFREQIHLYVDGELAAPEVLELERHLLDCPSCNTEYGHVRAVVDTVRGAKPLYEIPEGSLEAIRALVDRQRPAHRWRPVRVAAVLATAGLAAFVLLVLVAGRSQRFAAFAAGTHLRYARGAMPLDVVSEDPEVVSRWLQSRLPFHLSLPDHPVELGQRKPYRLAGARLLQFGNDDAGYLAYEMAGKPISLLVASAPQASPSGGDVYRSGRLLFHFSYHKGLKVISWTDNGLHYSLVSEVAARGAESCVICHGTAAGRRIIDDLAPNAPPSGR